MSPAVNGARSPSATPRWTAHDLLWLAAAAVAFALPAMFLLGVQLDDAYIFARYARNVWRFGDVVWNPGEHRVEGFSSWLWLGVHVIGQRFVSNPLLVPKLVGLAAGVGLIVAVGAELRRTERIGSAAIGTMALLAFSPAVMFFAASGMDHIAWCLLAWLYLVWIARAFHIAPRHLAVAALAILVRPEGFILFVPAVCVAFWNARTSEPRRVWPRLYAQLGVGLAVLALLLFARHALFDSWLPNAAAAKHYGGPFFYRLADGAIYLGDGIGLYLAVPIAMFAVACSNGLRHIARSPSEQRLVVAAVSLIAIVVAFVLIAGGDDISAFGTMRLVTPAIAPAAYLFFVGCRPLASKSWGAVWIAVIVAASLAARLPSAKHAVQVATDGTRLSEQRELAIAWTSVFTTPPISPFSQYLRDHTPPGAFIAVPWAGRVPWETDLPTIDLLGLNDAHIANTPIVWRGGATGRYDADYVLSRKPYFICEVFRIPLDAFDRASSLSESQLNAMGAFRFGHRRLLQDPRLHDWYVIDAAAPSPGTCFRLKPPQ